MNADIKTILKPIFLAVFSYASYLLSSQLIKLADKLETKDLATIVSAMTTVFIGLAAVIINQRYSKQRETEEAHRENKVNIYKRFLNTVSGVLAQNNVNVSKNGLSEQELIDYLVEFKTELLLWGSPNVIKRQLEFESASRNDETKNDKGGIIALNNLYKAIREDIGLSNRGLNNRELVKMYLSNPSEIDK